MRLTDVQWGWSSAWWLLLGLALGGPAQAQLVPLWPLPVPDTLVNNAFGAAVALGPDRAVVGAGGVHGCGPASGAVYVYHRQEETWRLEAVLQPDDCAPGRYFGRVVALDSNRILVAAAGQPYRTEQTDAAYVFVRRPNGMWQQVARLTAPDTRTGAFGAAVALEGLRAVVSTWGDPDRKRPGAAYVFVQHTDERWELEATLTITRRPQDPWPGGAVALSGNTVALAAPSYRYDRPSAVLLFVRRNGRWQHDTTLTGIRDFNPALALAGGELLVGERLGGRHNGGRVRHYRRRPDGRWELIGTLDPPQPYPNGGFGAVLAFDGRRALVSGFDEQLGLDFNVDRVVYVFVRTADRWCFWRRIDPGEKAFGAALSLHGDRALVGVPRESAPGAAYLMPLDAARCVNRP
ncbi:hypothetical protein [Rhodothermus profundi]|uniref:FG-GAP repeat-containing protein n=1 Tax=Rhodothermus profundi TaxID=633813 RepID=A0A1M6W218_9BACT|nr:hypothetical protein [Rhodothermus profundi]SHK87699.1 FG-GAP repeat-containing protein [Rhodothermus profundi]